MATVSNKLIEGEFVFFDMLSNAFRADRDFIFKDSQVFGDMNFFRKTLNYMIGFSLLIIMHHNGTARFAP